MWNTGCNRISNQLESGVLFVDQEDRSLTIQVGAKGTENWKSVIFPWCVNNSEISRKAFRVSNLATGQTFLYLFQDYRTNQICWALAQDADMWGSRRVVRNAQNVAESLAPQSAIDIIITPNDVWGFPTPSENAVFQQVMGVVLKVAEVAGTIAAAVL